MLGRTPLSAAPLAPGPHVVRVALEGFQPWQETLSAGVGDLAHLHARLIPRSNGAKHVAVREGDLVGPGPDVIEPQRIWGEAPAYPPAAKAARMEGQVSVAILVDEEGRPARVTVTESAGPVFDRTVVEAVSTWRFAPARKAGVRVKYVLTRRQVFELARSR
jgi:TonB family protein